MTQDYDDKRAAELFKPGAKLDQRYTKPSAEMQAKLDKMTETAKKEAANFLAWADFHDWMNE